MTPAWTDESAPALLRQGYEFISRRCDRDGTDVFETRVAGVPVTCLARPGRGRGVLRPGPVPPEGGDAAAGSGRRLLGVGGVQGLDGEAHRRRKELFLSLMGPDSIDRLVGHVEREWHERSARWAGAPQVVLFDEVGLILCAAAHAWTGVPLLGQRAGRAHRRPEGDGRIPGRDRVPGTAGDGPPGRAAETGLARTVERVRRETSVQRPVAADRDRHPPRPSPAAARCPGRGGRTGEPAATDRGHRPLRHLRRPRAVPASGMAREAGRPVRRTPRCSSPRCGGSTRSSRPRPRG